MSKYINADECEKYFYEHMDDKAMEIAMLVINEMPTADVAEVKHGRWTTGRVRGSLTDICSVCGCDCGTIYHYDYCPNCGAKMDEVSE